MSFTAADVKTLREMTSVGMMDCKKALVECDGDMDKAVEWLREKGLAKAAKKLGGSVKFVDAVRYQTGEGIEKKQEDFAAEVAAQMNAGK